LAPAWPAPTPAEALRTEGFAGRIVLLGAEPHRPYERPPLSKGYLHGSAARDTVYVHPPEWYADHQIDLRLGTAVTALDRRAHEIVTADGNRLRYNNRLLARVQAFLGRAHLACLVQETLKVFAMVAAGGLLLVTSIWNSDRPLTTGARHGRSQSGPPSSTSSGHGAHSRESPAR
jgi:hypothetical protein